MDELHAEVLTGKERRRRWSAEEKLRIVSEALAPGVSVSSVARRHGLHPNQVFIWRTQARAGELAGSEPPLFVPAEVSPLTPASRTGSATGVAGADERGRTVEVVLSNGRLLRAQEHIAPQVLARLAAALEGS